MSEVSFSFVAQAFKSSRDFTFSRLSQTGYVMLALARRCSGSEQVIPRNDHDTTGRSQARQRSARDKIEARLRSQAMALAVGLKPARSNAARKTLPLHTD